MQSVGEIALCSWWKVAVLFPCLREQCLTAVRLITSYNVSNRGRRCDTFKPDTLEYMLVRCEFYCSGEGSRSPLASTAPHFVSSFHLISVAMYTQTWKMPVSDLPKALQDVLAMY